MTVSFGKTQQQIYRGRGLTWNNSVISSDDITGYLDVVDARVERYIRATCPSITTDDLKKWRANNYMKLMEPFEWLQFDDYRKLHMACEQFHFESIVDEIFQGEYGNFFHVAALRIYMYEVVQNSGIIPFEFVTINSVREGFPYKVIKDVKLVELVKSPWTQRLIDLC